MNEPSSIDCRRALPMYSSLSSVCLLELGLHYQADLFFLNPPSLSLAFTLTSFLPSPFISFLSFSAPFWLYPFLYHVHLHNLLSPFTPTWGFSLAFYSPSFSHLSWLLPFCPLSFLLPQSHFLVYLGGSRLFWTLHHPPKQIFCNLPCPWSQGIPYPFHCCWMGQQANSIFCCLSPCILALHYHALH